jgi:hypothetical protein
MEDILNGVVDVVVAPDVLTDVYVGFNTRVIVSVGVDFTKRISGIIGLVIVIIPLYFIGLSMRYDPHPPLPAFHPPEGTDAIITACLTGSPANSPGTFKVAPT